MVDAARDLLMAGCRHGFRRIRRRGDGVDVGALGASHPGRRRAADRRDDGFEQPENAQLKSPQVPARAFVVVPVGVAP
jgi:hypothetical protein